MKRYNRCVMNFENQWANTCLLCMAGALFALAVYYFGLVGLSTVPFLEAVFCLFLPLVFMAAFIVLFRVLRWNAPGLYAIIGLFLCFFLFFGTFSSGNILRIILALVWYTICALILISCAGGNLPGKHPAVYVFPIAIFFRVVVFGLGRISLVGWVYEISAVLTLAALGCLLMSFESQKIRG